MNYYCYSICCCVYFGCHSLVVILLSFVGVPGARHIFADAFVSSALSLVYIYITRFVCSRVLLLLLLISYVCFFCPILYSSALRIGFLRRMPFRLYVVVVVVFSPF